MYIHNVIVSEINNHIFVWELLKNAFVAYSNIQEAQRAKIVRMEGIKM